MADCKPFPLSAAALTRALREAGADRTGAAAFADAYVRFGPLFGHSTLLRIGHFLAQLMVECDRFKTTVEYASGAAYEGRRDLGNTQPGDGKRFKGRGRIQTTGRNNYRDATRRIRAVIPEAPDFLANPQALAVEPYATLSALVWWDANGANAEADRGDHVVNVQRISRGVNRGSFASRKPAYHEETRVDAFRRVMTALRAEGL